MTGREARKRGLTFEKRKRWKRKKNYIEKNWKMKCEEVDWKRRKEEDWKRRIGTQR